MSWRCVLRGVSRCAIHAYSHPITSLRTSEIFWIRWPLTTHQNQVIPLVTLLSLQHYMPSCMTLSSIKVLFVMFEEMYVRESEKDSEVARQDKTVISHSRIVYG
eukprot:GHVN01060995.1.p1 GENE.GHVN01060995.1~~GHVN01060995.1.p1  ORF type:complete len:104 (-),score=21.51 GHVN01060995.1:37-348(-)